ncbi:hypothetical protein FHS43_002780 [Streptosporangium becharense]|uniref:Uncharacterized protein n=1 Tax=Streptosporangium becharense TaxID=1816182 RepID=A0A7W9IL00_9ACTN|nr:hypothetical protein [Streptosporangium becharense]MBB2911507.1 hypothetical protein [Streptosporangium becharense]MBB5822675.1 hypothetical protein [Streptosporangium becharense]
MTLIDRIKSYLRTPSGRRNMEKAKAMARDPRHQQKARQLLSRFRTGHTHR